VASQGAKAITENGLIFHIGKNVFYNPFMELSRTLSSLAINEIDDKLRVLDAFAASGIRGMRYALECKNVESVDFVDAEPNAVKSLKKNLKKHKINGNVIKSDAIRYMLNDGYGKYNFIDLDPFGSPVPSLHSAIRAMRREKVAYISATATDTAVLCGTHPKPCIKNYHSKPMLNEFCHETGLRILVKRVMESAHEFNFGIEPLLCFYYRHQMKIILRLRRGAEHCDANLENLGYVFALDKDSVFVKTSKKPIIEKKYYDYAGPLWTGDLADRNIAKKALKNADGEAKRMLELIKGELGYPPFFLSLSDASKYRKMSPPKTEDVINSFKKMGGSATKAHFDRRGIKYKGSAEKIMEAFDKS
jgi:tRNA (guanine26-N2/guanine27-N2)-dimethyltransferase